MNQDLVLMQVIWRDETKSCIE